MTERQKGAPGVPIRRGMSRRDFLKVGGAGLAGTALLGTAGCGGGGGGSGSGVNLTFAMGADTSGTLQGLIDTFNKEHKPDIQVSYREMPTDTGQYLDKLTTEFQAQQSDIDVVGADVIWTAQFAANGWIVDVSDDFPESAQSKYLAAPIESLIYDGKIWGKPWFTDAGMLYYRKDLLEESGISAPPKTWPELQEMGLQVAQETGTKYAFVFQGSEYEGGTVNGLEYIWTHGGDALDGNKVVIDSPEAIAGLETERSMVESGASPKAVATYTETETDPAFLGGQAVFARNWPYMYALAGTSDYPKVKPEQIGVSPLPMAEGGTSTSSLGGWNMLISGLSDYPEEAWTFVEWMTAQKAEKLRATEASLLPTLKSLYDDPEVVDAIPVIKLGETALKKTTPRPVSPYYADMSLAMAEQFAANLSGDVTPEEAAKTLQDELTSIQEQAS